MSDWLRNRHILVIGSQCEAIGRSLTFLPEVARDLFRVMTDPEVGGCSPSPAANGLLIDPTAETTRQEIAAAFQAASNSGATLFLAFIGHGLSVGNDFYLLLRDTDAERVNSLNAVHLADRIKEEYRAHSGLDGLVVLVDACSSGAGAADAAAKWVSELSGELRFEMMTAAADKPAYGGCFTKTLVNCLNQGMPSIDGGYLYCRDVRDAIRRNCPNQEPQLPSFNASNNTHPLARNRAKRERSVDLGAVRSEIYRLTIHFEPTSILSQIVERARQSRGLALIGLAGVGKSTLAAALACPEVTHGIVPNGFAQAAAFFPAGLVEGDLVQTLAVQLERNVTGFAQAKERFFEAHEEDLTELDALQRELVGPLSKLRSHEVIRIVVDGLDLVPGDDMATVLSALEALAALPQVRVIATGRPDTRIPVELTRMSIGIVDDRQVLSYLSRRAVPERLRQAIIDRARGNWLVADLLAELAAAAPQLDAAALPARLSSIYAAFLRHAGATTLERWRKDIRPVLGVLAVVGVQPIMPFKLLCVASAKLGGPDRPSEVRDRLVDLRGLVVRDRPGTGEEHVGLFHDTFVEYLLDPSNDEFAIGTQRTQRALVEAIAELAPINLSDPNDPVYRYALAREAEHMNAIGERGGAIVIPEVSESESPAENLRRWRIYAPRIQRILGPDHPDTLKTRATIAYLTDRVGDASTALQLFVGLLRDRIRVLGPDDPDTLATRGNIANCLGEMGDARTALQILKDMLPDRIRVQGPDHPGTLTTRANIAAWTLALGDKGEALRLEQELLRDRIRILGPYHPETLGTRADIAVCTHTLGDAREALHLLQELLADRIRVLGPYHPSTLETRTAMASCTPAIGDERDALRLLQELLADEIRVLGPYHPSTLETRADIADRTGKMGDAPEALRLFKELLADQKLVSGPNDLDALATRSKLVRWTHKVGDLSEALGLGQELLTDQAGVLGPDNLRTLETRADIASWTGELGDAREALRLFEELLMDQIRVLGPDHPRTLGTRFTIADWTAKVGDARKAQRLLEELLADQTRILGPDHPDLPLTKIKLILVAPDVDDAPQTLGPGQELPPDRIPVQGHDHSHELAAGSNAPLKPLTEDATTSHPKSPKGSWLSQRLENWKRLFHY